jgi:hypothetical protein
MYSKVSLSDLIDAGLLPRNTVVVCRYKGQILEAKITAKGLIQTASGETFKSPSAAAKRLNGNRPVNGWVAWKVGNKSGPSLAKVRKQLAEQAKIDASSLIV